MSDPRSWFRRSERVFPCIWARLEEELSGENVRIAILEICIVIVHTNDGFLD
jgi:hypothetical protein